LNLFLAGAPSSIGEWLRSSREDPRFADIQVKFSRSETVPIAKLQVKIKAEIIAFRREDASPLDAPRAPAVSPSELRRWIAQGHDDSGRRLALVDTRNREETDYGSFADALLLPIDNFTELPAALDAHREALADAAVVGFCTGGIRCEKAVLWMRANGFPDALQLDGGILGYFEREGGAGYRGDCFVFDDRVALDPDLRPTYGARASSVDMPVERPAVASHGA
ncbi:MAG: sulfurtransferase, partial [Xanthomonadaceae bacterium]|nr:sulfurtransferase [Xanthomonadaceae bacterium]